MLNNKFIEKLEQSKNLQPEDLDNMGNPQMRKHIYTLMQEFQDKQTIMQQTEIEIIEQVEHLRKNQLLQVGMIILSIIIILCFIIALHI